MFMLQLHAQDSLKEVKHTPSSKSVEGFCHVLNVRSPMMPVYCAVGADASTARL